jgi:hypothetical protein
MCDTLQLINFVPRLLTVSCEIAEAYSCLDFQTLVLHRMPARYLRL